MASAAHVYGKPILGAEAFTATDDEKWQGHPGIIKDLGDWAFCEGINRFVFHRYALQPWRDRAPGMSMGPWGLHYERTQTWWEQSRAWHEYLARCQFLLQQGLFVADICYLQPGRLAAGDSRRRPRRDRAARPRRGYNFDGCTPEVVLTRMTVKDGRLVLPDGMSYRVLVLPQVETMTPRLLRKIKELVEAGATVVAPSPPQKSPEPERTTRPATRRSRRWPPSCGAARPAPAEVTERARGQRPDHLGRRVEPDDCGEAYAERPHLGSAQWIWYHGRQPGRRRPRRASATSAAS